MCRWLWEWLLFFEFVWNCDEKHITKVKKTAYVQTIYHCSIFLNNIFFFWKYKCRKMFTNWITCYASGASVIWIATKLGTQKQYWVHDFHRVWMKSEYFFLKFQKNNLNVCLLWIAFYLFAIQGAHMLTPAGEGWIPRVLQVCVLIGVMQWSLLRNGFQAFVKGQRSRRQRLQRESVWCNTFL